ncbi:MAG TPA: LCP family protein [Anaerolineales bacterium]|nr:LCP family protein [Anaerolineales bacterium]
MQKSRLKLIGLISGAVGILLTIAGMVFYPQLQQRWSAPLGPGLELPTYTATLAGQSRLQATASPTPAEQVESASADHPTPTSAPQPLDALTPTPRPLCGGPALMTILAIGADSGSDYKYGLADVIRIARVDFVTPKISVLSMPRDLWVEIPGITEPYGITHGKLNQAYFYGGPGMGYYKGPGAGPGLLARTLDLNFGLRVDHYGAVNMQTFVKIVDAVGGIDIYLPNDVDGRPIDDKTEDMGYFSAGQQQFNGDQALRFARIRKKYNDFTRMDHQNMVICALKEKITRPAVLPKIPQIIAAFQGAVLTDLSLEQISQLACLAPRLKRENILFTSLPEEILTPGRVYSPQQKNETFVMQADYEVIRDYTTRFMAGTWPSEPDEPTCP